MDVLTGGKDLIPMGLPMVLVTGAIGQVGAALIPALRQRYGDGRVIAAGHRRQPPEALRQAGPWLALDVRDGAALTEAVRQHRVTVIYHLAALLSSIAEADPQRAWDVNVNGLLNVLEAARLHGCKVFHPSSIGVFGPSTPRDLTPQETIQRPATMYGVTKVAGELLCDYYHRHFGVDTRGLRYPGLLSYESPPGGGTTDYAVEIFSSALREGRYTCYLAQGTKLDMMYMPDAIRAAIELMEADPGRLRYRNAYNVAAMSFAPEELAAAIRRHLPDFTMEYAVDPVRQAIADSWPHRLDDSAARSDWDWQPAYKLAATVADMLARLAQNMGIAAPPPAGGL